jgi:uncharacterized protein (DUF2345 family)
MSEGSEDVFLMCGSSYVHLTNKGGQAHVEVTSAGSLLVHAAGHLQLEGDSVQIWAKSSKYCGNSSEQQTKISSELSLTAQTGATLLCSVLGPLSAKTTTIKPHCI